MTQGTFTDTNQQGVNQQFMQTQQMSPGKVPAPSQTISSILSPGPSPLANNAVKQKVLTPYALKSMKILACMFVRTRDANKNKHESEYNKMLQQYGFDKYQITKYLSFDEMYVAPGNNSLDKLIQAKLPNGWRNIDDLMTTQISFLNLRTIEKKICLI
jgi:hypothetical protein